MAKIVTARSEENQALASYKQLQGAGVIQKISSENGSSITLSNLGLDPRYLQNRIKDVVLYVESKIIDRQKGNGNKTFVMESATKGVEIVGNSKVRVSGKAFELCKEYIKATEEAS